jgi:hypothetical protein
MMTDLITFLVSFHARFPKGHGARKMDSLGDREEKRPNLPHWVPNSGERQAANKKGLAAPLPKSLIFLVGVEGLEPSTN